MSALDFNKMFAEEKAKLRQQKVAGVIPPTVPIPQMEGSSKSVESSASLARAVSQWESSLPLRFSLKECGRDCVSPPPPLPQNSLFYYPTFLNPEDGSLLQLLVLSCPNEWHTLKHAGRRVQVWGDASPPVSFPQHLQSLIRQLSSLVFPPSHPPNHVLINDYSERQGIMPHTDGPIYYPLTATLSLCSSALLKFSRRLSASEISRGGDGATHSPPLCEVLLDPGSLLVFKGEFYENMLHGIEEGDGDGATTAGASAFNCDAGTRAKRGRRISLTFRHKLIPEKSFHSEENKEAILGSFNV